MGRHSIYFGKFGFRVSAFDLSVEGTKHLKDWAEKESLLVDVTNADMLKLPYADNSFDALFAYHVIFHTNSVGIKQILSEISRVLKVAANLEQYCNTFCRSFCDISAVRSALSDLEFFGSFKKIKE